MRRISSVPSFGNWFAISKLLWINVEIRYLKNLYSNRPCENPTTKKPTTKTSTLIDPHPHRIFRNRIHTILLLSHQQFHPFEFGKERHPILSGSPRIHYLFILLFLFLQTTRKYVKDERKLKNGRGSFK